MSKLKRGYVDPDRSLLCNVIHYRWADHSRSMPTPEGDLLHNVLSIHYGLIGVAIILGGSFAVGFVAVILKALIVWAVG